MSEIESVEVESMFNEIEVLKKLSSKCDYVINYLDSFASTIDNEYKVYNIVTSIYEVNYLNFIFDNYLY